MNFQAISRSWSHTWEPTASKPSQFETMEVKTADMCHVNVVTIFHGIIHFKLVRCTFDWVLYPSTSKSSIESLALCLTTNFNSIIIYSIFLIAVTCLPDIPESAESLRSSSRCLVVFSRSTALGWPLSHFEISPKAPFFSTDNNNCICSTVAEDHCTKALPAEGWRRTD